jgi:putative toxin-antitoxin system antitoxin component (TIGR02293 family)
MFAINIHPMKNKVSEPAEAYQIISKYGDLTGNNQKLTQAALKGLKTSLFSDVIALTGFSRDLVAGWLDVSNKTLMNYEKQSKYLKPGNTELLLKIILLFEKGMKVFGERIQFIRWLEKPAYGLGGYVPLEMMHTSGGVDLIIDELTCIEYGDLA